MCWSMILLYQGSGDHTHAQISIPTQSWEAEISIPDHLLKDNVPQRLTDWVAGFMEPFCSDNSISAVNVETGAFLFGEKDTSVFNVERIRIQVPLFSKFFIRKDVIHHPSWSFKNGISAGKRTFPMFFVFVIENSTFNCG